MHWVKEKKIPVIVEWFFEDDGFQGLVLVFEDVEWLKPVHHNAKEVHGFVQYGMYAFMVIHIFGVLRADITKYGGIVSRMINGKEVSN